MIFFHLISQQQQQQQQFLTENLCLGQVQLKKWFFHSFKFHSSMMMVLCYDHQKKKYYYYHQTIPLKEIVWIDMDTMAIIIRREREKNVCVCKSFIYEHNTHRKHHQFAKTISNKIKKKSYEWRNHHCHFRSKVKVQC